MPTKSCLLLSLTAKFIRLLLSETLLRGLQSQSGTAKEKGME